MKRIVLITFIFLTVQISQAFQDPTGGKPFFPWLWKDELKPVIQTSVDRTGMGIATTGIAATIVSHQYDDDIYENNLEGHLRLMDSDTAGTFAVIGSGAAGISVAVAQLFFDQTNGLKHARALMLTSATHVTISFAARRERPGGRGDFLPFASSFPSGHTSSAFASATCLTYAYGPWVGIPAYGVATMIGLARLSDNAHWTSDIIAGAALGVFWARASYAAPEKSETTWQWTPAPVDGGLVVQFDRRF